MTQSSNEQHGVFIQSSTFNSARGDIHIVHQDSHKDSESGLHSLSLAVSHGAIHDSAERYPPPNCHPDTRKAVRQIILDWIHSSESSALPFFWLYGPAGAGKTAILQAIAEFLCSLTGSNDNFGGSFFFSRGKNGRDQGHFLFLTIAYQLALNVPGLRQHVNRIMEVNPTLHTKSLAVQLQTLIVDAFQSLSPLPRRSYLVIIDGLDECQDKATQQLILRLLCDTVTARKLPLRFLIGSRPESHIRASFDQKSLYTITQRIVLDESFNPGRDIQVFLKDGFAKIAIHADILSRVEQPWPKPGVIDLLVQRSSGQFIYAATVLKFVGADLYSPTKQLALVLMPNSTAFSDLDQLYTQILSVYPSTANIVEILGIIMAFDAGTLTPAVIEDILGMEEGEVKLVLRGLSSLIAFVGDENEEYLAWKDYFPNVGSVYLIHASFRDYLVDSSRSGSFHVNEEEHKNRTTIRCFYLMTKWTGRSWRIPVTTLGRLPHSKTWDYFKSHLAVYFIHSPKIVKDVIMTDINNLVQEFWKISSDGAVDVFFPPMGCLMRILKSLAGVSVMNFSYVIFPNISKTESEPNYDTFLRVFQGYQKMLLSALSKSRDMSDLLRFLSGIVVQKGLTMQGMADLYRVKLVQVKLLSQWALQVEPFIGPTTPSDIDSRSTYTLEGYISDFLRDRDRSRRYYCDPMLHHVFICRRLLSLRDGPNASDLQSLDLAEYVRSNLYQHLCAATEIFLSGQNIPGDHPAVSILDDLDRTTYYHLDANQSHCISYLAQYTIRSVVRWADMLNGHLKGTTVLVSGVNLIQRLRQVTDRIYREILRVETHDNMTTITLCAPLRILQVGPRSMCRAAHPGTVQLSWELLVQESVEGRISPSFTNFITTPERSGPLYIRPDVYHTRITEYSLETIFQYKKTHFLLSSLNLDNCCRSLDWSFEDHISHAFPTEIIFYLLGSIHLLELRREYNKKSSKAESSMVNLLEVIIKWLEGLGSKRPSDLYDRFKDELDQAKLDFGV